MSKVQLIGNYVKAIGDCGMSQGMPVYGILKYKDFMFTVELNHFVASVYVSTIEPAPQLEYHREPTEGEIQFGEGATHYKSFEASQYLKPNGKIKKWLVCPIDGLRYYRYF